MRAGYLPSCVFRKTTGDARHKYIICNSFFQWQNSTAFSSSYPFIATQEYELVSLRVLLPTSNSDLCARPPAPEEVEAFYYDRPGSVYNPNDPNPFTTAEKQRQKAVALRSCAYSNPSGGCDKVAQPSDHYTKTNFYYLLASGHGGKCPCLILWVQVVLDVSVDHLYNVILALRRLPTGATFNQTLGMSSPGPSSSWIYLMNSEANSSLAIDNIYERAKIPVWPEEGCLGYACIQSERYCPCNQVGDPCKYNWNCHVAENLCIPEVPPSRFGTGDCTAAQNDSCALVCGSKENILACICNVKSPESVCKGKARVKSDLGFGIGIGFGAIAFALLFIGLILCGVLRKKQVLDHKITEVNEEVEKNKEELAKPAKPSALTKNNAAGVAEMSKNYAMQLVVMSAQEQALNDANKLAAEQQQREHAIKQMHSQSQPPKPRYDFVDRPPPPRAPGNSSGFSLTSVALAAPTGEDHICPTCQQNYATEEDLQTHRSKRGH